MMIHSLAHINLIRQRNPNLNFDISALPAVDGYTGKRGLPYASWGIGISNNSSHKEEAWKLVSYLTSPEVNGRLVVDRQCVSRATSNAKPDFSKADPLFVKAFKIFQTGKLANEFIGLPVAEQLQRDMDIELQKMLDGQQTAATGCGGDAEAVARRVLQELAANNSSERRRGIKGIAALARQAVKRAQRIPSSAPMNPHSRKELTSHERRSGASDRQRGPAPGLLSYRTKMRRWPLALRCPGDGCSSPS